MWSKEKPPPVGYNLYVRIGCPECTQPLYFKAYPHGSDRRRVYCNTEACALKGFEYNIVLSSNECKVVE